MHLGQLWKGGGRKEGKKEGRRRKKGGVDGLKNQFGLKFIKKSKYKFKFQVKSFKK